jgi:tRNA pseudouridine55 synthase
VSQPRRPPRRRVDGVLLLDKPSGMTSNAALQAARRLFNAAKAGHTGTLDPLATGLLPLCFGEATKFAGELLDADKAYRATLRLGVATDTADAEGRILETRAVRVTEAMLREVLAGFQGEIEQVPPMHSALKRHGKPLYEYARAGIEIERRPRRVCIDHIELLSLADDEAVIAVDCSKGTYVRTLAADIGDKLGCGAHLAALRRLRIGMFDVTLGATLNEIEMLSAGERDHLLRPVDLFLAKLPSVELDESRTVRIRLGQAVSWQRSWPGGGRCRLVDHHGTFLGVGVMEDEGWLRPHRLLSSS